MGRDAYHGRHLCGVVLEHARSLGVRVFVVIKMEVAVRRETKLLVEPAFFIIGDLGPILGPDPRGNEADTADQYWARIARHKSEKKGKLRRR